MTPFKEKCVAADKVLNEAIEPAQFFLVIDDGKETHVCHTLSEKRLAEVLRSFLTAYDSKRN